MAVKDALEGGRIHLQKHEEEEELGERDLAIVMNIYVVDHLGLILFQVLFCLLNAEER